MIKSSRERAIWYPFWYELDQSITVGQADEFEFFKTPPDYVQADGLRVFYHGNWRDTHLYTSERKQIKSISHPILGQIERIDAEGLVYKFTTSDGRVSRIEAEENPGLVYELSEHMKDWRIFVEMLPA